MLPLIVQLHHRRTLRVIRPDLPQIFFRRRLRTFCHSLNHRRRRRHCYDQAGRQHNPETDSAPPALVPRFMFQLKSPFSSVFPSSHAQADYILCPPAPRDKMLPASAVSGQTPPRKTAPSDGYIPPGTAWFLYSPVRFSRSASVLDAAHRPLSLQIPLSKNIRFRPKAQIHMPRAPMPVFRQMHVHHNRLRRLPLPPCFPVIIIPVQQQYAVGVLFGRAAFPQIRQHGPFICTLLVGPVKLRQAQHRRIQRLGQPFERVGHLGIFGIYLLPVLDETTGNGQ